MGGRREDKLLYAASICEDGIRRAKVQLELKLARSIKGNKSSFLLHRSDRRKERNKGNTGRLLL